VSQDALTCSLVDWLLSLLVILVAPNPETNTIHLINRTLAEDVEAEENEIVPIVGRR